LSSKLVPFLSFFPICSLMQCLRSYSCGTRRTLAVVSGALLAGGAFAYARASQRPRRRPSEPNCSNGAGALAANVIDGRLVGTNQRNGGLKSLQFLTAILLKKIGPNGTRFLLGLILTSVSSAIFALWYTQLNYCYFGLFPPYKRFHYWIGSIIASNCSLQAIF
jgi:hypothetical protein